MTTVGRVVPYCCLHLDADFGDLLAAARRCLRPSSDELESWCIWQLQELFTTAANPNPVLPCLSARTGFDLFCQAMEFPPGSEIIVSAINIPDMITIAHSHQLRVVPLDVNIDTLAPKVELLPRLIGEHTVAVVVAHLYGTRFDVGALLEVARHHGLLVVEDCAEAFGGFDYLGHPLSDLALFSFGVIKYRTAFGGAIAKVRDAAVYRRMALLHRTYRRQTNGAYLQKLTKYAGIYFLTNVPWVMWPGMVLGKLFRWDYQRSVVDWLRGFPAGLLDRIRLRPSSALLVTMTERLGHVPQDGYQKARLKGQYVARRLGSTHRIVGSLAEYNNYWLFPILVENSGEFSRFLNDLGVDSYKGSTQLDVVLPCPKTLDCGLISEGGEFSSLSSSLRPSSHASRVSERAVEAEAHEFEWRMDGAATTVADPSYPHEAKFLIDHVVYLPVHKDVPIAYLDAVCDAVVLASVKMSCGPPHQTVVLKSKL